MDGKRKRILEKDGGLTFCASKQALGHGRLHPLADKVAINQWKIISFLTREGMARRNT